MMLPSKGYFSGLACPFFDSGLCLRPHCHYRHSKKGTVNTIPGLGLATGRGISSAVQIESDKLSERTGNASSVSLSTKNSEANVSRIQEFVTESVKVLSESNSNESIGGSKTLNKNESVLDTREKDVPSYKPTPIAELNKRHIPVVYAPTKPASIVRKKEVKESLLYLPKSISKSVSTSNAYVPSSSGSSVTNSYTYQPSKISTPAYSVKDCKTLLKGNVFVSEEEKLSVLDRLVEEEFGSNYNDIKMQQQNISKQKSPQIKESSEKLVPLQKSKSTEKVGIKLDKSQDNILLRSMSPSLDSQLMPSSGIKYEKPEEMSIENILAKLDREVNALTNKEKNGLDKDTLQKKSLSQNHQSSNKNSKDSLKSTSNDDRSKNQHKRSENSKSKSSSFSSHKTQNKITIEKVESHSSVKDLSKPKTKPVLSDKGGSNSKSKTASKKNVECTITKNNSIKEENVKTKNSESTKHNDDSKTKRNTVNKNDGNSKTSSSNNDTRSKHKPLIKDEEQSKSKSYSSKEKTSSSKHKPDKTKHSYSDHERKKIEQKLKSSTHKKCRKKDKEIGSSKSRRDRDYSPSPPPAKIMKIEISSDEESTDGNLLKVETSDSGSSDIEEVLCNGETIVIDSSSNSSVSNLVAADDDWPTSPPPSPPHKKSRLLCEENTLPSQPNLQSILCERWRKARETVLMKSTNPGKVKISQVPNVKNMLNAKDELFAKTNEKVKKLFSRSNRSSQEDGSSCEEYVPKSVVRVAHSCKQDMAAYPVIKYDGNLKMPSSVRQSCLNNLYDEYKKYLSPSVARERAVEKEYEICGRTTVIKTYQNSCAVALLRIRKTKAKDDENARADETKLCLLSDSKPDFTHGWTIYECFKKYLISDNEYISNGYPIPLPSLKGCCYIDKGARRYYKKQPDDQSMRICNNCSKLYYVDENGFPQQEQACLYHWGRLRKTRSGGGLTEIYICCGADIGSEPCSSSPYHVANSYDEDCLEGFVKTRPLSSNKTVDSAGIYGLDCEMCYTTKGPELARCTLVDLDGEIVYDKVVVPDNPILDYCTRFSGMTESIIRKGKLRLKDVQRDILNKVSDKTILVGHSLENDLKALRIFHKTVVDTSLVFPHKEGPPLKRSLKVIVKDVLHFNIQEQESGHDSKEDANACIQLMLWKIKEDAKGRKPRVIISLEGTQSGWKS